MLSTQYDLRVRCCEDALRNLGGVFLGENLFARLGLGWGSRGIGMSGLWCHQGRKRKRTCGRAVGFDDTALYRRGVGYGLVMVKDPPWGIAGKKRK